MTYGLEVRPWRKSWGMQFTIRRFAIILTMKTKGNCQNWDPTPNRMNETDPLKYRGSKITNNEKNTIYVNESVLYSLILRSKLESVKFSRDGSPKRYCHPLGRQEGTIMMT